MLPKTRFDYNNSDDELLKLLVLQLIKRELVNPSKLFLCQNEQDFYPHHQPFLKFFLKENKTEKESNLI